MKKRTPVVHGILLLDKPTGATSNFALSQLKTLYSERKLGHTGSLDPLATGMLVCCFGDATKFAFWLLTADKEYETVLTLGERTDTGDSEGKVIASRPVAVTKLQLDMAVASFRGSSNQTPPMYSAVKHKGKALYKLARQGIEVERKARQIEIYRLDIEDFTPPHLSLSLRCSKGVYVRTLADELGEMLGCGAHVSQLRRARVGSFQPEQMHSMEELTDMSREQRMQALLPCDAHLGFMPKLEVTAAAAQKLHSGCAVPLRQDIDPGPVRLYTRDGHFFGLAETTHQKMVHPKKILSADTHPSSSAPSIPPPPLRNMTGESS